MKTGSSDKSEVRGQRSGEGRNGAPLMPAGKEDGAGRECGNCSHFKGPLGLDVGKCGDEPVFRSDICAHFDPVPGNAAQTGGDACRAVVENGTAALSPDIVERIGKVEVKPSALACDLRCLRGGGACERDVCTSACKLTANIEMVEEEKQAAIAPCPFCGQPAKHLFGMNEHWVSCTVCGASGPMADTKQKALDVWNTRPFHPEAKTPTQRAAFAALDFCAALDVLPADEACKAIEVMKQRLAISLIKAAKQKEVPA